MTKAEKLMNEYAICKQRGHEEDLDEDSVLIPGGSYAYRCQYCKTLFWEERIVHERDTPKPTVKRAKS